MAEVGTLYFVLLSVFVALAVVNFALKNDPPVNYFWLQSEKQLLSAFGRCAALKTSRFPSSSPTIRTVFCHCDLLHFIFYPNPLAVGDLVTIGVPTRRISIVRVI